MMSGAMTQLAIPGVRLIASDTYLRLVKVMLLRSWTMSCTFLEEERKMEQTLVTWQHSEYLPGGGTHSRTWDHHLHLGLVIA